MNEWIGNDFLLERRRLWGMFVVVVVVGVVCVVVV
jgi:hypothetical protein